MGGRHTDPDRGAFWRSLAAAAGKALLVLVLLAGLTTLVVYLTGDTGDDDVTVLADAAPTPTPTPHPEPQPEPADDGEREQAAADGAPGGAADEGTGEEHADARDDVDDGVAAGEEDEDDAPAADVADPSDLTVQVIDSGGGSGAVTEVVNLLEGWGYDIVAVNPGLCCFEATTLFYSDGRAAEAEALQARDDRFAVLEENRRLDEAVALHVVVGEDWYAP